MNPWYIITLLGEPALWLIFTGVLLVIYLFMRKGLDNEKKAFVKKCFFVFGISIWLTIGAVGIIKANTQMERPCVMCTSGTTECNPHCPFDTSFPSGHSAVIFAVFTAFHICIKRKWFMPFFGVPALVALSRYALEVHYVSDIVVGSIIGATVPLLVLKLYEKKS
ncbi:MAG: phosphatase PAP2 family protein [Candidatus Aenigmarchaeota archaeon]|nr:phosphatase PAP2 family protein [Candidatus Aenigmarchaeota archaeon]